MKKITEKDYKEMVDALKKIKKQNWCIGSIYQGVGKNKIKVGVGFSIEEEKK